MVEDLKGICQAIQIGLEHHQAGRIAEAEAIYQQVLRSAPDQPDALHWLGVIALQVGKAELAVGLIKRALAAKAFDPLCYNNLGLALQAVGKFDEAVANYAKALAIDSNYAGAHYNLGGVYKAQGKLDEALASYRSALAIHSDYIDAHVNVGTVLQESGKLEEALASYDRALALRADYAQVHNNRGIVLRDLGRSAEAMDSFDRALIVNPDYADAHCNRAAVLQALRRLDEALDGYDRAIMLQSDNADAHNNRAHVLLELKRYHEALDSCDRALAIKSVFPEAYLNRAVALRGLRRHMEALESCERALALKPDFAEAYHSRAAVLAELERHTEALESSERALALKPEFAEAYNNRGAVLLDLKRYEEAIDCFARALQIKPDVDYLYGQWLYARMQICDWTDLSNHIGRLRDKILQGQKATAPFIVTATPCDVSVQRRAAETWVRHQYPTSHALPPISRPAGHGKIRVGYFSSDFRAHPVAYSIAEMFERHDKSRFELTAFSFGPDARGEVRGRLAAACDRFVDVSARSDQDVAMLARESEIDIGVDLNGHTQHARTAIFALRAAPVQVNYLGYAGTMAAAYIDYLIADATTIPDAHRMHYSERIVYLPNSYLASDTKRCISDKVITREEAGLPPNGFVYCCFNNSFKITPGMLDCWARILDRVPASVLWLFADNESAASNLYHETILRGIGAQRLIFAPRVPPPEHLARLRLADLFLDTLPYNSHSTASDALWVGVPVLTRIGETFVGRVAASLLKAVRLPELITTTPEQYEALAIDLATHTGRLSAIRQKLVDNRASAPLFDIGLFTRHMESAYSTMHERYRAGLAPEPFSVQA